jgi:hypothetical protein
VTPSVVPSNHHSTTAGTITTVGSTVDPINGDRIGTALVEGKTLSCAISTMTARRPFKTAFRARHYPRPLDRSPIEAPSRQVAMAMMPSPCCRMTASRTPRGPRPAAERFLLRNSYLAAANADIGIQAPHSLAGRRAGNLPVGPPSQPLSGAQRAEKESAIDATLNQSR